MIYYNYLASYLQLTSIPKKLRQFPSNDNEKAHQTGLAVKLIITYNYNIIYRRINYIVVKYTVYCQYLCDLYQQNFNNNGSVV